MEVVSFLMGLSTEQTKAAIRLLAGWLKGYSVFDSTKKQAIRLLQIGAVVAFVMSVVQAPQSSRLPAANVALAADNLIPLAKGLPPNAEIGQQPKMGAVATKSMDISAPSCSAASISAAISAAKNAGGGTVYLPPCDVSLNDQEFHAPGGVSIIGSGRDRTILRDALFLFDGFHQGIVGNGISRFSGMSIINDFDEANRYFEVREVNGMRIDHMYFEGRFSTFANAVLPRSRDNAYILIDHSEFNLVTSYGFYTFGHNTYFENVGSNACVNLLGTGNGSGGAVFVEDNVFKGRYDHLMDGRTGAHYVFRHNTITYDSGSGPLEGHGPTAPGADLNVGTNAIEIYGVTITQLGSSGSAGVLLRSGCGVVFDTTIINKSYGIAMAVEDSPYHWPRDAASYPTYHQPHGLWFWNNTFRNIRDGVVTTVWDSEEAIQKNRDYFLRAPAQEPDGFTYTPYAYPHPAALGLSPSGVSVPRVPRTRRVFYSTRANDGWVLESGEKTNRGGALNRKASTLRLGDNAAKKQYRGILSFKTGASLPDTAVITAVTLKVKRRGIRGGGNPVTMLRGLMVDFRKGVFGKAALRASDFQARANKSYGSFKPVPARRWYSINLTRAKRFVNKRATRSGLTQIRLRFKLDDNNNAVANVLNLYSGNAPKASRPQLIIQYYVP